METDIDMIKFAFDFYCWVTEWWYSNGMQFIYIYCDVAHNLAMAFFFMHQRNVHEWPIGFAAKIYTQTQI